MMITRSSTAIQGLPALPPAACLHGLAALQTRCRGRLVQTRRLSSGKRGSWREKPEIKQAAIGGCWSLLRHGGRLNWA